MSSNCLKKIFISFGLFLALSNLSCNSLEDSFFKKRFGISNSKFSNFLKSHHVTMSDLNLNEKNILILPKMVSIEFALSALKGIENEIDNDYLRKDFLNNKNKEDIIEINEWNKLNKEEFLRNNINETKKKLIKENGRKGLPEPYYINNIKEEIKNIRFYFHNNELKNKELIYKGKYIPNIYNNIILISIIFFSYIYSFSTLTNGFIYGKNVAKNFIPIASTLFVFFFTLKIFLSIFPILLSSLICLILTFQFNKISMFKCNKIPYFQNKKLNEQPIGWLLIICFHSLILANLLYHMIFNIKVLNYIMLYINGIIFINLFYFLILLLLSICIFYLTTANILSARKIQNFVFSLISSYLLLSFISYISNLILLRYFHSTNIFQIEPIMFFSNKPKFVFNNYNTLSLLILVILILFSLKMPKWIKKINNFFGMKKKNIQKTQTPTGYDMFLNLWT